MSTHVHTQSRIHVCCTSACVVQREERLAAIEAAAGQSSKCQSMALIADGAEGGGGGGGGGIAEADEPMPVESADLADGSAGERREKNRGRAEMGKRASKLHAAKQAAEQADDELIASLHQTAALPSGSFRRRWQCRS